MQFQLQVQSTTLYEQLQGKLTPSQPDPSTATLAPRHSQKMGEDLFTGRLGKEFIPQYKTGYVSWMAAPKNHIAKLLKMFSDGCGNGKQELIAYQFSS